MGAIVLRAVQAIDGRCAVGLLSLFVRIGKIEFAVLPAVGDGITSLNGVGEVWCGVAVASETPGVWRSVVESVMLLAEAALKALVLEQTANSTNLDKSDFNLEILQILAQTAGAQKILIAEARLERAARAELEGEKSIHLSPGAAVIALGVRLGETTSRRDGGSPVDVVGGIIRQIR